MKSLRTHGAERLRRRVKGRAHGRHDDVVELADLCVQLSREVDRLSADLKQRRASARARAAHGDPYV